MTNEEYIKAIELRQSRRSYKQKPLDKEIVNVIKDMVQAVNGLGDFDMIFVEDAKPAFTLFTGRFSMIVVTGPDSQKAREDSGYYGESIVLQCVYHGLGTCWASGTYNENKVLQMIDLPRDKRIYAVITIGYVKNSLSAKEKIIYNATHKKNKPYQNMFEVCDKKLPDEYVYGMQLIEKAPSATNRRPVKFRYEKDRLSACVDEPYSDKSIDFGIAKLHFLLGVRAKGINGQWTFDNIFQPTTAQKIKFEIKEAPSNE